MTGKYAAFIQRKPHEKPRAVVFSCERILIVMVNSAADIPYEDLVRSIEYSQIVAEEEEPTPYMGAAPDAFSSFVKQIQVPPLDPSRHSKPPAFPMISKDVLLSDNLAANPANGPNAESLPFSPSKTSAHLNSQLANTDWRRPPPYVLHGDVDLDIGPLVNRKQMIARLIMRHGDLKAASITIVDGSPRGPPPNDYLAERGSRTIYVVGRVRHLNGPLQKDHSVLNAYTYDLGPNEKEFLDYTVAVEAAEWQRKMEPGRSPDGSFRTPYGSDDGYHRSGSEESHEAYHPVEHPMAIP